MPIRNSWAWSEEASERRCKQMYQVRAIAGKFRGARFSQGFFPGRAISGQVVQAARQGDHGSLPAQPAACSRSSQPRVCWAHPHNKQTHTHTKKNTGGLVLPGISAQKRSGDFARCKRTPKQCWPPGLLISARGNGRKVFGGRLRQNEKRLRSCRLTEGRLRWNNNSFTLMNSKRTAKRSI